MDDNVRVHDAYQLLMFVTGEPALSRKILLALAHIYPKAISANQLVEIIEYSHKSRVLSRGILAELEQRKLILRDKLTQNLHAIRINHDHALMKVLIEVTQSSGQDFRTILLDKLLRGDEKNAT
ncbi:MAG: hypothetical protein RBG13Loki_3450 [Promethearchaeota archaeon CR_4]|nr:MAG: hypothetical protein RBG13Loki_3450 [Candidatus Lokiarchaeota archaeon CR_4]